MNWCSLVSIIIYGVLWVKQQAIAFYVCLISGGVKGLQIGFDSLQIGWKHIKLVDLTVHIESLQDLTTLKQALVEHVLHCCLTWEVLTVHKGGWVGDHVVDVGAASQIDEGSQVHHATEQKPENHEESKDKPSKLNQNSSSVKFKNTSQNISN